MAFDKTDIVNRALVKLGSRTVVNVDDDNSPESIAALNVYDIALEAMLAETLWTFATKRVLLQTLSATAPFSKLGENLQFVYQRPNDTIRIFETNHRAAYWKEEGDTILSDTEGLGISYTFRNENTATYPSHFVEALSDKLAHEMSFNLLNSNPKAREMLDILENISLPKAMSQNAQIGTPKELNDNYWVNSRHGGPQIQEFS